MVERGRGKEKESKKAITFVHRARLEPATPQNNHCTYLCIVCGDAQNHSNPPANTHLIFSKEKDRPFWLDRLELAIEQISHFAHPLQSPSRVYVFNATSDVPETHTYVPLKRRKVNHASPASRTRNRAD
jgi:hypothetical protein